jgi:ketol-acid reductoisomerase
MARIYSENDARPDVLAGRRIAIVGYGSQGRSHALNLRDSGADVRVGLYEGSPSRAKAEADGFAVTPVAEATEWADVVSLCTPDVPMAAIFAESIRHHLQPRSTLVFVHGFNIHYKRIQPPPEVDVVLVSPKAVGPAVRSGYLAGGRLFCLIAVGQNATGRALETALAYGWGIGCRRGLFETSFAEETETDLFGEQAVLCGGIPEVIRNGYETLVEAGYSPEAAYFECVHEAKLIVDLIYERGLAGMREAISDTAEWGGLISGPRVVDAASRQAMREILEEIRDGRFTRRWIEENEKGLPEMDRLRKAEAGRPLEEVGERIRARLEE